MNMRILLIKYLQESKYDKEIRVVVISGNGKAFCAGADIEELYKVISTTHLEERKEAIENNTITDIGILIRSIEKPVIAAVHGYCFGGGLELTQYCDLVYATEDTLFSQPEINIGIIPGGGGTQNLPRIIGVKMAKELIFLGERINAETAIKLGLINKILKSEDEMESYVNSITEKITSKSENAIAYAKRSINSSYEGPLNIGFALEREIAKNLYTSDKAYKLIKNFIQRKKN